MQPKLFFLLFFFSSCLIVAAQSPSYPKGYFGNPLGIPMQLVANFGELRPNHWHMGLDIRTEQKENHPVYAAAAGIITHIGIRPQSFGRFIIINHPNGFSTLYAHLNDFYPELEAYVEEQQYNEESWEVELDILRNRFPVAKGQLIAYSGNTGGSQGPHLHFEIRNTQTGECLNPLLFGLPIRDQVAPDLVKVGLYDRSRTIFESRPVFFPVKKNKDSGYSIPKIPIVRTGWKKISFAIQAYDRMNGSDNKNGIYAASLYFDEQPMIEFVLDSINYDVTQYVNAQIDYPYRYNGGPFVQHLSQLPGDHGGVYKPRSGHGVISLDDTAIHVVRIEVRDAYQNVSQLRFTIQRSDSVGLVNYSTENEQLPPYFPPNRVSTLKKPGFEMYLPANCLYDSVRPVYFRRPSALPNSVSDEHEVMDPSIPLHSPITVRIKPDRPIADEWKDKIVIQRNYRNTYSVRKARWEEDTLTGSPWLTARFPEFGNFQAFIDKEPPRMDDLGPEDTVDLSPEDRIVLLPTDNFGVIRNFRAELDGQWICFTNDKGKYWVYKFDDRCPFGVHELTVEVEDLVGNATTKSWWFKRYPYTPPKKKAVKKTAKKKMAPKKLPPLIKKKK